MRVLYAVPGPMSRTPLGRQELDRRAKLLQEWALPGTETEVWDAERGPASIESAYEEYLSVPAAAELVVRAEREGFDATVLGCLGDPGLDALREVSVAMPVVGPGEASCHLATMVGERFGIVTIAQGVVNPLRHLVARAGLTERLAGIAVIDVPVLELADDRADTVARVAEASRELVARQGADALVLGCMSMAFLDLAGEIGAAVGVPVVNPAKAALHVAETLVGCGLSHSKAAYPVPAKLASGSVDLPGLSVG